MAISVDELITAYLGPQILPRLLAKGSPIDIAAAAISEAGEFQTKLLTADPALARDPAAASISKSASAYIKYGPTLAAKLRAGRDEKARQVLLTMCREIADHCGEYFGARYFDHRADFFRVANLLNYLATRIEQPSSSPPSEDDFERWLRASASEGAVRKYFLRGQSVADSAGDQEGSSFWSRLFGR